MTAEEDVRALAVDGPDGCENFGEVLGENQAEQVVHVADLVADGELDEASGNSKFSPGDAEAAVRSEDACGGV